MGIALRQSDNAFGVVSSYYAAAKREPTLRGDLEIGSTDSFKANFLDLVRMLAAKQQSHVVIVAHGGADGFIMPVTDTTSVSAQNSILVDLLAIVDGLPTFDGAKVTAFATNAGCTEDQVRDLATVCNRIRVHESNCLAVHVRGCKIGKKVENLATLRKLFNSVVVSAPTCPMLYANFSPIWRTPSFDVDKWKADNSAQTRRRDFTVGSSKLAMDVEYGGSSASTQGAIERIADLRTFANDVYGNTTHGKTQAMPIAAMWPDAGYFLPHEAGYKSQIVTSKA